MDEVAIANLVYRAAELFDRRELEEAASLFAHARVQLREDEPYLKAAQLLEVWRTLAPSWEGVQHLVSNPIIEVDSVSGKASCRSRYTMVMALDTQPLQVVEVGQYEDEFERIKDGGWRFSVRRHVRIAERAQAKAPAVEVATSVNTGAEGRREEITPTRLRILEAAQQIFSTMGYSEAGIRKIADVVGLSPTILFRHFGTKAALFEEALIASMGDPKPPVPKAQFGEHVAGLLADPNQINCPHAMSLLATGNEEAREIAIRVLRQYAVEPMIEWLGGNNAESRAREIMALCAGFALYNSQLNVMQSRTIDQHMVRWLAKSIQAVVDGE